MAEIENTESERQNRFQNNYIFQAWLCIMLALIFGISLAAVQAALGPVISANKLNETKEKVPEILLGRGKADEMAVSKATFQITPRSVEIEKNGIKKIYSVFETRHEDGRLVGWVTKVSGQGYADRIELLLGLDPSIETITGLFILDQKETPGLGNKIVEPKWRILPANRHGIGSKLSKAVRRKVTKSMPSPAPPSHRTVWSPSSTIPLPT